MREVVLFTASKLLINGSIQAGVTALAMVLLDLDVHEQPHLSFGRQQQPKHPYNRVHVAYGVLEVGDSGAVERTTSFVRGACLLPTIMSQPVYIQ